MVVVVVVIVVVVEVVVVEVVAAAVVVVLVAVIHHSFSSSSSSCSSSHSSSSPSSPHCSFPPHTFCFLVSGAVSQCGCLLGLFFWEPHPEDLYLFFIIAALWGMSDAVWQTQIGSKYCIISTAEFRDVLRGKIVLIKKTSTFKLVLALTKTIPDLN